MAGSGERKSKKDDNGIGTAIDFVLSNARLVLGVGGASGGHSLLPTPLSLSSSRN